MALNPRKHSLNGVRDLRLTLHVDEPFSNVGHISLHSPGAILRSLLAQTAQLRDFYRYARTKEYVDAARRIGVILDEHYREQLRIVDVLIDRIRESCGDCVFAGDLFGNPAVPATLCGPLDLRRLLLTLQEAHESILTVSQPGEAGEESHHAGPWYQDFAVGQVVLTNHLQIYVLEDLLAGTS